MVKRRLQTIVPQVGGAQRHQFQSDDVAAVLAFDPSALLQAVEQQVQRALGHLAGPREFGGLDRRGAARQHAQDVVGAADGGDVVIGSHDSNRLDIKARCWT